MPTHHHEHANPNSLPLSTALPSSAASPTLQPPRPRTSSTPYVLDNSHKPPTVVSPLLQPASPTHSPALTALTTSQSPPISPKPISQHQPRLPHLTTSSFPVTASARPQPSPFNPAANRHSLAPPPSLCRSQPHLNPLLSSAAPISPPASPSTQPHPLPRQRHQQPHLPEQPPLPRTHRLSSLRAATTSTHSQPAPPHPLRSQTPPLNLVAASQPQPQTLPAITPQQLRHHLNSSLRQHPHDHTPSLKTARGSSLLIRCSWFVTAHPSSVVRRRCSLSP